MTIATDTTNPGDRTARTAEVPNAAWHNGMNFSGSNAPGIGINIDGGEVVGTPEQFTLLDQFGDPRTPQMSQIISGNGWVDHALYPSSGGYEGTIGQQPVRVVESADSSGDGTVTLLGQATLTDLATGWTAVAAP